MKKIHVVGAIIIQDGKIFCAQRSKEMSLPLLWEFPGGKIEAGETQQEALKREIMEEMKCDINVHNFYARGVFEYPFGEVTLDTYLCSLNATLPTLTEHSDGIWLKKEELNTIEWAPADIPIIEKLISDKRLDIINFK